MRIKVGADETWYAGFWTRQEWPEAVRSVWVNGRLRTFDDSEERILVVCSEFRYVSLQSMTALRIDQGEGVEYGYGSLSAQLPEETWFSVSQPLVRPTSPEQEFSLAQRAVTNRGWYGHG